MTVGAAHRVTCEILDFSAARVCSPESSKLKAVSPGDAIGAQGLERELREDCSRADKWAAVGIAPCGRSVAMGDCHDLMFKSRQ